MKTILFILILTLIFIYPITVQAQENISKIQELADQGNYEAQYSLGIMYIKGQNVSQNYFQAAKWFIKAADQGDDRAQFYLGLMYKISLGVPRNIEKSKEYYRQACLNKRLLQSCDEYKKLKE